MTLSEFVSRWNNQFLEVVGSGNALNQCVDLANAYIRDVLGLPIIEWTNAVDFPGKVGDKYDYILNTLEGVPQAGDLVVWKPSPGHIAVFLDGDVNKFNSFDQNYPLNSPCHIQTHTTYFNVTGWLRKKGGGSMPTEEMIPVSLLGPRCRGTIIDSDLLVRYPDLNLSKDLTYEGFCKLLSDARVELEAAKINAKKFFDDYTEELQNRKELEATLELRIKDIEKLRDTLASVEKPLLAQIQELGSTLRTVTTEKGDLLKDIEGPEGYKKKIETLEVNLAAGEKFVKESHDHWYWIGYGLARLFGRNGKGGDTNEGISGTDTPPSN